MKLLVPLLIALVGLGTGVGAGLALKPAPEEEDTAAGAGCAEAAEAPCETAEADPFAPVDQHAEKPEGERTYVPMDKPFVVPVFKSEKVAAMVVVSLSVETDVETAPMIADVAPRLRDSFLKAMFRHANSGGFDGSFTAGRKMDDLKSALLAAALEVVGGHQVSEVLITDIARQDG